MKKMMLKMPKTSKDVLKQVEGVWELILNSDRIKDVENDIVMQVMNYTATWLRLELVENPSANNWQEALSNCALAQPFVPPKVVDKRSGLRTPGAGSIVWDNAKLNVDVHLGGGFRLNLNKVATATDLMVNFHQSQSSLPEDVLFTRGYSTREAFAVSCSFNGTNADLFYADDTNSLVLMVWKDDDPIS